MAPARLPELVPPSQTAFTCSCRVVLRHASPKRSWQMSARAAAARQAARRGCEVCATAGLQAGKAAQTMSPEVRDSGLQCFSDARRRCRRAGRWLVDLWRLQSPGGAPPRCPLAAQPAGTMGGSFSKSNACLIQTDKPVRVLRACEFSQGVAPGAQGPGRMIKDRQANQQARRGVGAPPLPPPPPYFPPATHPALCSPPWPTARCTTMGTWCRP